MSEAKSAEDTVWVPLDSLRVGEDGINFIGRIISLRQSLDRKGRPYFYGFVGDGNTSIPYVAFREMPFKVGDIIEVRGARVEEWDEEVRVAIPTRAEVRRSERVDVAYPKVFEEEKMAKIGEIKSGDEELTLEAVVLDMERSQVTVRGRKRDLLKGVLGDETGKVHFTSWRLTGLELGGSYRIKGVYVKSYRGRMEVIIDEWSTIEPLESEKRIKLPKSYLRNIASIKKGGGGLDVEIEGFISYVSPRSGFSLSCPECERKLKDGICAIHGEVKGFYNLRVWVRVTDNTSTIEVLIPRVVAQKLLNLDSGELLKVLTESPGEVGREEFLKIIRKKLAALPVRVVGDVIYREKRPAMIVAKSIQPIKWAEIKGSLPTLDDFLGGAT